MKLTADERRAVKVHGDPDVAVYLAIMAKQRQAPIAEGHWNDLRALRRSLPTTKAVYTFDAMERRDTLYTERRTIEVNPARVAPEDAKPVGVFFGCGIVAKYLRAAVASIITPGGTDMRVQWYGRFLPVVLSRRTNGVDLTAVVMPVRLCAHGGNMDRGVGWFGGLKYTCLCRDCAAGRTWGWT